MPTIGRARQIYQGRRLGRSFAKGRLMRMPPLVFLMTLSTDALADDHRSPTDEHFKAEVRRCIDQLKLPPPTSGKGPSEADRQRLHECLRSAGH